MYVCILYVDEFRASCEKRTFSDSRERFVLRSTFVNDGDVQTWRRQCGVVRPPCSTVNYLRRDNYMYDADCLSRSKTRRAEKLHFRVFEATAAIEKPLLAEVKPAQTEADGTRPVLVLDRATTVDDRRKTWLRTATSDYEMRCLQRRGRNDLNRHRGQQL